MKKDKNNKISQRSFYFQDYNHNTVNKIKSDKLVINQDRVYLLFFIFFCLIFIFATKIFFISLKNLDSKNYLKNYSIFKPLRNDILDRNGEPIARNILVYHAAIKPNLIKNRSSSHAKVINNTINHINRLGIEFSQKATTEFLLSTRCMLKRSCASNQLNEINV